MPKHTHIERQAIHTAPPNQSIWREVSEESFRRSVVELNSKTSGVGWATDVVPGLHNHRGRIVKKPVVAVRAGRDDSEYRLPLALEERLSDDLAFLAATQEGAGAVSAGCIEEGEHAEEDSLILRLAANEGVTDEVKTGLERIWAVLRDSAQQSQSTRFTQERVFEQIVRLSRSRIFQRIRSAVSFRKAFVAPRDILADDLESMKRQNPTEVGDCLLVALRGIHKRFRHLINNVSDRAIQDAEEASMQQLRMLAKECFFATTTTTTTTTKCDSKSSALFNNVLLKSGLDPRTWMSKKSIAQIEKIGSYWRIARTLTRDFKTITPLFNGPPTLRVESLRPYKWIKSNIAIKEGSAVKEGPVKCFVHAEIQLLCYYNLKQSSSGRRLPRAMGTSKLPCFLCFLTISAYGGFRPPGTHGRVYDKWTIPDLAEYGRENADILRRTVEVMSRTIKGLCSGKHQNRPWQIESRVHIYELPPASTATASIKSLRKVQGLPNLVEAENQPIEKAEVSEDILKDADRTLPSETDSIPTIVADSARCSSLGMDVAERRASLDEGWINISEAASEIAMPAEMNMELFVEAEATSRGKAQLDHVDLGMSQSRGTTIVLEELEPGTDVSIGNSDGGSDMMIDFCRNLTESVYRLHLRWI